MKYFEDVVPAFEITNIYIPHWSLTLDDSDAPERIQERDRLIAVNANAYLLLMIGQLEVEINRLAADLIKQMKEQAEWKDRRVWDDLEHRPEKIRQIGIMRKVALLTDKSGAVYKRIKALYETRNDIAHGDLLTEIPDVAETAKDIERIVAELNEAS